MVLDLEIAMTATSYEKGYACAVNEAVKLLQERIVRLAGQYACEEWSFYALGELKDALAELRLLDPRMKA